MNTENTTEINHWNNVYSSKAEDEVSWFQLYPKTSMDFVELLNLPLDANIIDVGGGDSNFVDALLDKGYRNIYVLDISSNAINRAKQRLGERAKMVHWIVSDITEFDPAVQFDLWHDRAAFHFLTTNDKINRYVSIAEAGIKQNGFFVLGTFSKSGPTKCSGLEIKQYSEASMNDRFERSFKKVRCIEADHVTPFDTHQNFLFCSFKKRSIFT